MDTEDKSVHESTVTYGIRFRALLPCSDEQISLIINVEKMIFIPAIPSSSAAYTEQEVSVMCNLSKGVEEKGIAKGRTEGRAEGIADGMTNGVQMVFWLL